MKLITFLPILFLAGCGKVINPEEWEDAKAVCENNGGIHIVEVSPTEQIVSCSNGAVFERPSILTQ